MTANVAKHGRTAPHDFRLITGGAAVVDAAEVAENVAARLPSDSRDVVSSKEDSAHFRRVLGRYPTGVVVVTTMTDEGEPVGMTIGSFTSVSLSPPLVAFFPDKQSTTWPRIRPTGKFCVNILGASQTDLCRLFAAKDADRFGRLNWYPAPSGCPIIDGVLAWVDCELQTMVNLGDHYLVTGLVRHLDEGRDDQPLVFLAGELGYYSPGAGTPTANR